MLRTRSLFTLLIGASLLGGCVPQEKYNALKLDRDGLAEQLAKSQSDANGARAEADSYKNQLQQLMANGGNQQGLIANLTNQLAALQAQNDDLNRRYTDAMNRPGGGIALPQDLSNTLTAFAQQNPDLVDFDAARGVVKFKSDIAFDVGQATITPKARDAISRFATILNSPAASGYELMVAGHTDNQRVTNPHTIAAGHKDNWYLSAHRAIAVASEMMSEHVNPQRIGAVGYADQRPIASNATSSGQAANRRVEVLILPSQIHSNSVASIPAKVKKSSDLNKDSSAGGGEMQQPANKN